MKESLQFYVDGRWVDPQKEKTLAVQNPANEETIGTISLGGAEDVVDGDRRRRALFEFDGAALHLQAANLRALQILQDCYPDRRVIGVDCLDLVWGLGAFHCMTQQQPANLS